MFHRRLTYLLVLLPTITEFLEVGRWPNSVRELITDVVLTAAIIFLVWNLQREFRAVVRQSETDPLTGLGNRRRLRHDLDQELARARVSHSPLTLGIVDLDRFKSVNDRFGHDCGDDLLAHLGRRLRQATRNPTDRWYRYGGDEFVVLLPATDAAGAAEILARIEGPISTLLRPYGVGLSLGFTEFERGDTANALIQRADRLLYEQKSRRSDCSTGRRHANGVVAAPT